MIGTGSASRGYRDHYERKQDIVEGEQPADREVLSDDDQRRCSWQTQSYPPKCQVGWMDSKPNWLQELIDSPQLHIRPNLIDL